MSAADTLSITVSLDAGDLGINTNSLTLSGANNADWWVVADTPMGLYYFTQPGVWYPVPPQEDIRSAYQGPLFNLAPVEVLNATGLPAGRYIFYFGIDTNMDGLLDYDHLYFDYVTVDMK